MYYIECSHCGFLNLIKTEYLTFCERCGKKLPHNFVEWSPHHPGKTFADFKKATGERIAEEPANSRNKWSFIKIAWIMILIIACTAIYFYFSGNELKQLLLPGNTSEKILAKEWNRNTYGRFGLSIETPGKPEETEIEVPVKYRQHLKETAAFMLQPSRSLQIKVVSSLFNEGVGIKPDGAAATVLNELINQPSITNVEFTRSPVSNNKAIGVLVEGFYHDNGVFMRFQYAVYTRKSNMWSVWVSYRDTDNTGRKVAERIMNSLQINYFIKAI